LLDFLNPSVLALQDFCILAGRALRNVFRPPHYESDILLQMDIIGVGSLPIVILIGFFTGVVITMQMSRALAQYGAVDQVGPIVAITLVRELGPVLTAILVAGRNASGIASELGSMMVTEQIDAMRALGTDPLKKLIAPRIAATVFMLLFLTIISDLMGLTGGMVVAKALLRLDVRQYWATAWESLVFADVVMGLAKPPIFGFIIATVGCYYGINSRGGTQGVGRATTQAVVASSVLILLIDAVITQFLMITLGGYR
jgi:phospholipid/cholesterol/gamma-HCH transport system permease protein